MLNSITALTVCYNTEVFIARSYHSIRAFHPDIKMIIVDGSPKESECYNYVSKLAGSNTSVHLFGYNIGHGNGMHYALTQVKTKYALIFDSDIIMIDSPVSQMLAQMEPETYATGWKYEIGFDGFDYGTPGRGHKDRIPYIHPYFMLLNVEQYFKFHRFCHHGAPCYKAMIDIYESGKSDILKSFAGLTGHTSGEGINWKAQPNKYIIHDFGGTRKHNRELGKLEIEGGWIK